jgi:pSer/pThr/pTyr-binding forkhead associated (FHA) protein
MAANSPKQKGEARAVLYFTSRADGEAIKLRRDATILGREKGDVLVNDTEVSSTHCQIQNIAGVYHLFDMNSSNGTYLNKNRIVKVKLSDGDIITIGKTSFRFALEEDAKVRHISTIFKSAKQNSPDHKSSLVDTLIEGEIRQKRGYLMHLKIKYKDGTFEEVKLPQKLVYIGRATSFGRFEDDVEISRKHVLIKLNDHGEIFIEDQGSTNGTYLNGNKIKGMHQVRDNEIVRVGAIELLISVKSS